MMIWSRTLIPINLPAAASSLVNLSVLGTGRYIGARVIVDADNRRGKLLQGGVDNLPDNGHGLINGAYSRIANVDDPGIAVQIDHFRHLRFEVAHVRQDDIDDILGRGNLLLDASALHLPGTVSRFQGRP